VKRRHFVLLPLAATGVLALGWTLLPPRQRLRTARRLPVAAGQHALNGWVLLGADDTVWVAMPKSEMGQGVHTGLAQVLADELDADWSRVRVAPAPPDRIYNNQAVGVDGLPFHPDDDGALRRAAGWLTAKAMREMGVMVTGGSSSMKDLWLPLRQAGASARAMLAGAAAQAWQVPVAELRVAAGVVSHASGRQARFGELAAAAGRQPVPASPLLKTPDQYTLIGRPVPRLEGPDKGRGTARFGLDVLQPGMLYASVVMCPTLGGRVAAFDGAAALKLPGVKHVVAVPGLRGGTAGVAAVADSPWRALQAARQVAVTWDEAVPAVAFSSAAAMQALARSLDTETGTAYFSRGDVDKALQASARTLHAEYRAPLLAHATLEPQNCTVLLKDGRGHVWAPTQVPDVARAAAAEALGLARGLVQVDVQLLGGGFGRRLDVDFIAQAGAIARQVPGVPVQTFWTREQDTTHDFYRPCAVSRLQAGLDAQGRIAGWRATSAGPAIVPRILSRLFGLPDTGGLDKSTAEGASDQPYEWPHARVAHHSVDLPVPVGFWRSVGHSHQAFFKEGFTDECAHAAGQDPVAYRAAMLQRHPRHRRVLDAVAVMAGWGRPPAPVPGGAATALGVALHHSFGSIVAQVAQVSVGADRGIRVHRVWCAIDCGTPVQPDLVAQQMEGAIVFGLTAALHGRIDIEQGRVQQSNFHDQPLLRMADCPVITTQVLPSTAPPEGVGEPGTPPIAPAVANALFALTGQRLRELPLRLA